MTLTFIDLVLAGTSELLMEIKLHNYTTAQYY